MYLYPVWTRIWHAFNAILCLALIVTGFSMLYSNPDRFVVNFSSAVAIHNVAGVLLTLNYFLFFVGNIFTTNGKHYRMKLKGLGQRLFLQMRYYAFSYFKGEDSPFPVTTEQKFNPLQQVSYVGVMYGIMFVLFITGWALLFPEFILKKLLGFSGIFLTAQLHVIMGFLVFVFLFIHLYVSTMGVTVTSNFKSIVNGWQEKH
ncbi:MAG: cytochrome b/b6 domain-containing protein [Tenuifilaceae bacterium]|nr:cytochrome b/b6 domain-containing protein [Tenuifilaceae bacterium]